MARFLLLSILVLAAFWRFANYPTRWVLNQDQARDASIALYSIRTGSIPLLGSPSSAGPFNFGPLYDYTIILFSRLFPFVSGPWVGFTLLSLLTVYLFYLIGVTLGSQRLGLILALVSACASELIYNSTDMLNTVIIAFGVTLTLLIVLKLITTKRLIYALFLGLCAGFTLNNHFQALGIFTLLFLTPFFLSLPLRQKLYAYLLISTGVFITFLPPILFDLSHNFVWITSVFEYYTGGFNKFWAPTSWRRDLFTFWPQLFGSTLIGLPGLGWPFFLFTLVILLFATLRRQLPRPLWLLAVFFLTQVLLLRYYPGVRSREYLIAFQPLIILFFGYAMYLVCLRTKILSLILIFVFLILSSTLNLFQIAHRSQAPLIFSLKSALDSQIPGPVSIHTNPSSHMVALPLFYLLYHQNRASPTGTPVFACINCQIPGQTPIVSAPLDSRQTYSLYRSTTPQPDQFELTPSLIYSWLYVNYQNN